MSSSIPSSLPGVSTFGTFATPEAAPAKEASKAQSYTPLWLVQSGGTGNSFEMLGIRLPSANGDLAALLAEISLTVERNVGESQANRARAGLAQLAGALSGFTREALQTELERKTKTLDEAKATQTEFGRTTEGPLAQQEAKTQEIAGLHRDIAETKQALGKPDLSDAERGVLTAHLAESEAALADAYADREAIDITLADAHIAILGREVGDLETQLSRAPAGSAEAATLSAELAGKRKELGEAKSHLSDFRAGARTEAARDAFSSEIRDMVGATAGDLKTATAAKQAAVDATQAAIQELARLTLLVAATAQSQFSADQSDIQREEGLRDQGIEKAFEQIMEGLGDTAARLAEQLRQTALALEAGPERAVETANAPGKGLAFLASVAELLAVLDQQAASPKAPIPVPPDTVASRFRFGL